MLEVVRVVGRLDAYVADNKLGDGKMVGERATLASQLVVKQLSSSRREPTRQIAASMRGASQVADLAGVDVFTMPLKVAAAAKKELDGQWSSRLGVTYPVSLAPGVDPLAVRLEALWNIAYPVRFLVEKLRSQAPSTGDALVQAAHDAGAGDLFPRLDAVDLDRLARDGKIPRHEFWAERVKKGEVAVDTLLTLAGLASFAADQQALDDRIRRLIA